MTLLTLLPFLFFVILLVAKTRLLYASWIFWGVVAILLFGVWGIYLPISVSAVIKGFFVALDIFFIVFGALYFLSVTQKMGAITTIVQNLAHFSTNKGIQIIFIAWFLESFLEGTAGFGTPSVVATPLLISLGLSPLTAVAIAMLGNSSAVIYGAAGTPIRVGMAAVNSTGVIPMAGLLNLVGFFVPTAMIWLWDRKAVIRLLPFTLWSGFSMLGFSYLATALGGEIPSILGPVLALLLTILLLKNKEAIKIDRTLVTAIAPYALLIFFLILGKFALKDAGLTLRFGLTHKIAFFNPGFSFILAGLLANWWFNKPAIRITGFFQSAKKAIEPLMVIFPISAAVQMMIVSDQNNRGWSSYLTLLAQNMSEKTLYIFAPFLGVLGSFVTGSATLANVMFSGMMEKTAQASNLNSIVALSLLLVGGAAGNMISLADILPALVVGNLKNKEMAVVKKVIVPCLLYALLAILSGLIFFA